MSGQPGRQGGAVSPFRTRRKPFPGGLDESSVIHTVLKEDTAPPWLAHTGPERRKSMILPGPPGWTEETGAGSINQ